MVLDLWFLETVIDSVLGISKVHLDASQANTSLLVMTQEVNFIFQFIKLLWAMAYKSKEVHYLERLSLFTKEKTFFGF